MIRNTAAARPSLSRLVVLVLAVGLTGCETFKTSNANIANTADTATTGMDTMQNVAGVTHDQPLILGEEVASASAVGGQQDPLVRQHIGLATGVPMTLDQIAAQITQQTNVPVEVSSQVDGYLNGTQDQTNRPGIQMPPLPGQTGNVTAPLLPNVSASQNEISITCDSDLGTCLDQIAAKAGVFWRNDNGKILFYLTETQTFDISALPGTTNINGSISNAGSTGQSGSGSSGSTNSNSTQQSASITGTNDLYKSVEDSINTILAETQSAGGSGTNLNVPTSVATNSTTGQVTVTATPPELAAVKEYMSSLNAKLIRNVLIELHIYSVTLNSSNNYGLNLQLAFQQVARRYGFSFSGATPPTLASGGATASAYVLSAATGSGLTTPTQSVVQALATQGDVALDTEGSVIAMNGQPTPMQVAENKAYIASSQTTNTVNAGNSTSLTPGQYTVGFTGTFLPLIRDNQVLLQFNASLTQDLGLLTQTSNGTEIQLPQTATQSFLQRVALRSGETLILSGFEQTSDQTQNTGIGASWFWGTGGGRAAQHAKQALVVVIHVEEAGS